jgi:steroid delta-isomerase-like uncharacterized protein
MSAEENKALARAFFEEIWNQGDESAIDRYIPEKAKGNDPDFGAGREGFRKQWRQWRQAFPDLHFEIVDLVAEGDKVLTRWVLTGTQEGEFLSIPATGKLIRVEGMSLDRIEDGMVVEGFDGWDNYGLRKQLGAVE